ncbi:MAG: 50S ribosomal protein L24 [archaeon]
MKKAFSKSWNSSKQPRKQRKYIANAPLHIKSKFLHAHLEKELRDKHQRRSFRVITGDKVKVMRGQFRGKEGKVERVDMKKGRVYVTKVEKEKIDGSKMMYPLQPSNLLITELKLDDKKRIARLKRGKK